MSDETNEVQTVENEVPAVNVNSPEVQKMYLEKADTWRQRKWTKKQLEFMKLAAAVYGGDKLTINRKQVVELVEKYQVAWPVWMTGDKTLRAERGSFFIPVNVGEPEMAEINLDLLLPNGKGKVATTNV